MYILLFKKGGGALNVHILHFDNKKKDSIYALLALTKQYNTYITTQIRILASKMCVDIEGSDNDPKTPN